MRLTKQQRIALGVLTVAVGALAVDKAFLGVTSPAPAAALTAAPAPTSSIAPLTATPAPTTETEPTRLAERLDNSAAILGLNAGRTSDAFSIRNTWLEPREPAPMDAPAPIEASPSPTPEAPRLALTTVLSQGAGGVAVLNGVTMRVGETARLPGIEGDVRLVSIGADGRSVRVAGDWGESTVTAPSPLGKDR